MYKQLKDISTGFLCNMIIKLPENLFIPFDPANTDYQKYLQWLSEGNEPLPPDEVTE
jgi:hypothetical protein